MSRNFENGIEFSFLDRAHQEYSYEFEQVLTDFFCYLIEVIREQMHSKKRIVVQEINCVISCSEDYNEDQIKALIESAKNAGMRHIKSITEVVSACLGSLNLTSFDFSSPQNVLLCNFGAFNFSVFLLRFQDNQFKVLASEKTAEVQVNEVDNKLFEMIADQFQEQVNFDPSNKDLLLLESLALTAKFFFANMRVYEDDFSTLTNTQLFESHQVNDEPGDNYWHAMYKEVELFLDPETFEGLVCDPLVDKISYCMKKIATHINSNKIKFVPDKIVFCGSLALFNSLRKPIFDQFDRKCEVVINDQLANV